jgi:Na+-translocating ferredoxin:NAD+ oxidoreductase RnfG subunit
MNKYLKYTLFLLILGLIAGFLLAFVNSITAPIIRESEEKAAREALSQYYPFANYKEVTSDMNNLDANIQKVYYAFGVDNKLAAVIYETSVKGYADQVVTLIAFNPDGTFIDAKVIAQKETKGKGDQYQVNPEFSFNVKGETAEEFDYDIIAGATVTGEAAGTGMTSAAKHLRSIQDRLGGVVYE